MIHTLIVHKLTFEKKKRKTFYTEENNGIATTDLRQIHVLKVAVFHHAPQ